MRVIGAGVGRTGTMSLKAALEKLLGQPCYHMMEVFQHPEHVPLWKDVFTGKDVDWDAMFEGYAAGVDWPLCSAAPALARHYPDALVLLSTRDFESWWKSASNTIFPSSRNAEGEWREMADAMFSSTFTLELDDKEACRQAFEKHYEWIKAEIPAERILEWTAGDGWEPICQALGVPVPDEPFPHTNTTEEFNKRRDG
ncbi:MAG: hypothetical protein KDI36_09245 [Pseudomonadales bacterium]|nr:hypothetical protein [Pseudomonadales bacterium]